MAVVIGSRSIDQADRRCRARSRSVAAAATAQRDERVVRVRSTRAAARRRPGTGVSRLAGMWVCSANEQRLEAALLGRAGRARPGRSRSRSGRSIRPKSITRDRLHPETCGVTIRCRSPNASRERVRGALAEAGDALAAALGLQRGHPHVRQPAGDDPVERRQVVVDVDGEAVHRDAARDVDADRGDLAVLDPHAGVVAAASRRGRGRTPASPQRGDERRLHRRARTRARRHVHDRIADELAGAVVGQLAAAVGLDDVDPARGTSPRRRQLAGLGAAAARVDRRVLEQQQQVGQLAGLDALAQALLQRDALAVVDAAEVADPELVPTADQRLIPPSWRRRRPPVPARSSRLRSARGTAPPSAPSSARWSQLHAEVRHRADRDRVVAELVGDHDRPLDDGLGVEDRRPAAG